jgi:hypothetical protein
MESINVFTIRPDNDVVALTNLYLDTDVWRVAERHETPDIVAGDCLVFDSILHDLNNEEVTVMLFKCFAMTVGGVGRVCLRPLYRWPEITIEELIKMESDGLVEIK